MRRIRAALAVITLALVALVAVAAPSTAAPPVAAPIGTMLAAVPVQVVDCTGTTGTYVVGVIESRRNAVSGWTDFYGAGWTTDPNALLNRVQFDYWDQYAGIWKQFASRGASRDTVNDVPSSGDAGLTTFGAYASKVRMVVDGGRDNTAAHKRGHCVSGADTPGT